jgi:hypothetical protein
MVAVPIRNCTRRRLAGWTRWCLDAAIGNSIWKMAFPDLETRRLRLRQVCRADALAVFRIFCEPDLSMYDGIERHRSISDSEFIDFRAGGSPKRSSVVLLALEDRVLKTVVGVCEV